MDQIGERSSDGCGGIFDAFTFTIEFGVEQGGYGGGDVFHAYPVEHIPPVLVLKISKKKTHLLILLQQIPALILDRRFEQQEDRKTVRLNRGHVPILAFLELLDEAVLQQVDVIQELRILIQKSVQLLMLFLPLLLLLSKTHLSLLKAWLAGADLRVELVILLIDESLDVLR